MSKHDVTGRSRRRRTDKRPRRKINNRRFIQLWTNVKRSAAYHSLNCAARAALVELLDRYNGCNNGMIGLGVRELADELGCSKDTASRALHSLDDAGLAHPTKMGAWRGKKATEWRLTFYFCDQTHEPAVTNWPSKDSVRQEGRKSPARRTSEPAQSDKKDKKA